MSVTLDLDAVRRRVEQYRVDWEQKRDARDRMVAEAARDKTSPPDHYWQEEHRARALYGSALAFLEALGPAVHNDG